MVVTTGGTMTRLRSIL